MVLSSLINNRMVKKQKEKFFYDMNIVFEKNVKEEKKRK
jgi:hypothetical protein